METFLLDITLAALLMITIGFTYSFHRKFQDLRTNKDNFGTMITQFSASITQAEQSIARLQSLSQKTSAELQDYLDKGQALRDDLSFLVERGSLVADQIANLLHQARPVTAQLELAPTTHLQLVGQKAPKPKKSKPQNATIESITERKLKKSVKK